MRDSKAPEAGSLTFTKDEWTGFINKIKSGEIGTP